MHRRPLHVTLLASALALGACGDRSDGLTDPLLGEDSADRLLTDEELRTAADPMPRPRTRCGRSGCARITIRSGR